MSDGSGVTIKLRKGDLELEIVVSKDTDEKQLRAIQKILQPFAIGLMNGNESSKDASSISSSEQSMYIKLKTAVKSIFRYGQWFTSIDAKEAFEDMYGSRIKLATCSTYLRRMEEEGFLIARKVGKIVEYRIMEENEAEAVVSKIHATKNDLV